MGKNKCCQEQKWNWKFCWTKSLVFVHSAFIRYASSPVAADPGSELFQCTIFFAILFHCFLQALYKSSFTSKTLNKKPEGRTTPLLSICSSPIIRTHPWAPCWSVLCMHKSHSRKRWHVLVFLDGFPVWQCHFNAWKLYINYWNQCLLLLWTLYSFLDSRSYLYSASLAFRSSHPVSCQELAAFSTSKLCLKWWSIWHPVAVVYTESESQAACSLGSGTALLFASSTDTLWHPPLSAALAVVCVCVCVCVCEREREVKGKRGGRETKRGENDRQKEICWSCIVCLHAWIS